MLASLQRLIHRKATRGDDLAWLDGWARRRGERCKAVRGAEGFVIDGSLGDKPLRMEWGAPQREYFEDRELRIRCELGLPLSMEMLVLTRGLADWLEAEAFDSLTQEQQTAVDTSLPEEGRWLAMYDQLPADAMPLALQQGWVAAGAQVGQAQDWLEGELGTRLSRAADHWLGDSPLLLMTLRGRLYLRVEARSIDEAFLDGVRGLADAAGARALQLAALGTRYRRGRGSDDQTLL